MDIAARCASILIQLIRDLRMNRKDAEDKLVDLRYRKAKLDKDLKDRRNLEKGTMEINSGRPPILRHAKEIERELAAVDDDIDSLLKALDVTGATGTTSSRGDLKKRVAQWAKEQGFKQGESVPSKKIEKYVRDLNKEGIKTKPEAVRATLSRLGYSKEKPPSDET
jgi:hypothetical protein